MAKTARNKFPADKTGTKYAAFKNTKRVAPGKVRSAQSPAKSSGEETNTAANS